MAKIKIGEGVTATLYAGGGEGVIIANEGSGLVELNTADPKTAGTAVQLEPGDSFIIEPGSVWSAATWYAYSSRGATAVVTTV